LSKTLRTIRINTQALRSLVMRLILKKIPRKICKFLSWTVKDILNRHLCNIDRFSHFLLATQAFRVSRDIALLSSRTLGTRWGGGSAWRPGRLYSRERPGTHCTGGWVGPRAGLDGRKFSSPPGFQTVQPVVRHMQYTFPKCDKFQIFRTTVTKISYKKVNSTSNPETACCRFVQNILCSSLLSNRIC